MEIYHVYNRGVDKRQVFMDDSDRIRFVHDLYEFNDEERTNSNFVAFQGTQRRYQDIGCPDIGRVSHVRDLLVHIHAWCLMGNHYHLMLSEVKEGGMAKFMKKLSMGYAKYFNEKYERSGALWQGKYKRILLDRDCHFQYLPFYIHLNPLDMSFPEWREGKLKNSKKALKKLEQYRWSSHLDYLGSKNFPSVIHSALLNKVFNETTNYKRCVELHIQDLTWRQDVTGITFE